VISDKTILDASAGYVKRSYPNTVIGSSRAISGESRYVATDTEDPARSGGWRQLAADLTAQTDYYVDKGGSISPTGTRRKK